MRKLSENEKNTNEVARKTKRYINGVRKFIERANDGEVPIELECSLECLEEYYRLFLQMSKEIAKLPSIMITVNGNQAMHPLLHARDNVVTKLDILMKGLGVTLKEQARLKVIDVSKAETNPLDEWMKAEVR